MRSDGWMLRYLLNRNAPAGSWARRDLAFWFDWVNDYISSNATIGRTGYDMNVSWNVSTGSDGDGSYIWINWNRSHTASTGTRAEMLQTTWPTLTQATSFTMKVRFKIIATQPDNASGLFGFNYGASIWMENNNLATWFKCRIREGASLQDVSMWTYALNTMYDAYLVYDANDQKMYCYLDSTLINVGWTTVSFSFTDNANLYLGDNSIGWWNASSSNKYIYHACIRNKALTQAEVDADIALWNTTKNDPSIVAYYIPDNLTYNTQYMLNSSDFSNASRTKTNTTVTADTTVAPDGTTTADTLTIWLWATSWVTQISTVVSGATVASKVFIVKAFVKVAAATSLFRLVMYQNGVATWTSANLTATTNRQEFTFTQTFTASTSATGITWWIINDSTWLIAPVIIAWKCRVYLTNETLRDESPNIWGYLWRKTNKVFSCWCKPWADWTASSQSQTLFYGAWWSFYISWSTNIPTKSIVTRLWAKAHTATALGNWYRSKVHVIWTISYTWWVFAQKIYVNWVLSWSSTWSNDVPTSLFASGIINVWVNTWVYYTWNIRDARIYTFTWSFTNADALAIYNGGEPTSSGITKYLHYKPPVGELWTTTQDQSTNNRDWTLNGWVTRDYI